MTHETNIECQALTFERGGKVATVVTDGIRTAVYQERGRSVHPTLGRAIASLEAAGWRIITDIWY